MDKGMRSYWAEFLGTFTLCFIGQGAIAAHQLSGALDSGLLAIALAHGLALVVMISALCGASGAHFNPAVTLGFVATGRMNLRSAAMYWIFQLLGALAASYLLLAVFPAATTAATHLGAAHIDPSISTLAAVMIEFVLTFFLVTAVWGTAVDPEGPRIWGFGIGLAVVMDILVGGPLTGAAMNPARAFGAAVASGMWDAHWVYWVGPMLGGVAAAVIYSKVVLEKC